VYHTHRRSTSLALLLIAAVAASGCGDSKKSSSPNASETRTVQMDGVASAFHGSFLAYFPKVVMVHPGDTVAVHGNWTGEPHSVTMGTLVEKGLAAAAKANRNGPPPKAYAALPEMIPTSGAGDAVQAGARPCYLRSGAPPKNPKMPCKQTAQPPFDGSQSYYSSGWIEPGQTWKLKLASNIKPGTYRYYCDLHGADMSGSIVVVPKSRAIPSQPEVDAKGKSELQALIGKATPAFTAAKARHYPIRGNLAGVLSPRAQTVSINEFVVQTIHTKVGAPVSWTFLGAHTLTLGGPQNEEPILTTAPDGSIHIRKSDVAPAGGPGAPPPGPPSGKPTPVTVNGGGYSGSGLHSSGLVLSFPPQLTRYKLTFSKPGAYKFDCLLHPHMEGKVVVTR
jgi:plastocyanin